MQFKKEAMNLSITALCQLDGYRRRLNVQTISHK